MKGKFSPVVIRRLVEPFTPVQCFGCGADGAVLCRACLTRAAAGSMVEADLAIGARYDGAVKDLVWQLKYHRLQAVAEAAAELVLRALSEDWAVDVVTAVPIAPARYRERGYNQAELVAKVVARRLRLPYRSLLAREGATHQVGLGRTERLAQIRGAFWAVRRLDGVRVLVVDDVVTTGATLGECAEVLRAAGAGAVWGAAVARH